MFRSTLPRCSRALSQYAARTQMPIARYVKPSMYIPSFQFSSRFAASNLRHYSAPAGLAKPEVEGRILDILKNFDKVGALSADRFHD